MNKEQSITIVGAGLAGALLAVFMAKRGFKVSVYEKRPDMRREKIPAGRSINLALADRGIRALKAAGVFSKIEDLLIPMPGRMLHDVDGNLAFQPYSKNPEEINYSVSRAELNKRLLDAAEASGRVEIHFNHPCTDVDFANKTLCLEDAAGNAITLTDTGPIIATDGAGSPVRQAMVRQADVQSTEDMLGHAYKELTIPPVPDGTHQIEHEALHVWPRGGYMLIALPNTDGSFTVTLFLPKQGEPSFASLNNEKKLLEFFQRDFSDTIKLIPGLKTDFFDNPTGDLGTIRCFPWHAGGDALLLGDAAHAVVPFHGQGMNCAFEDCRVLDECIEENGADWARIFPIVSDLRKPNADAIADMALENYIEMRDSVRNPKFHLNKKLEWLLEDKYPGVFIPRYSIVMFHGDIPYAEAQKRGVIQKEILEELTGNADDLSEVDLNHADLLINEKLRPYVS
ncbi:MAG: FAD-dependent monooxygenase [Gammaproteobacteria bacterium]|nr:FAD-dependent monooxygenase [Gammaproteobacteria bacterium]